MCTFECSIHYTRTHTNAIPYESCTIQNTLGFVSVLKQDPKKNMQKNDVQKMVLTSAIAALGVDKRNSSPSLTSSVGHRTSTLDGSEYWKAFEC